MELYQAIILGIVQGLAEFLPVSSSGHLVLFQNFFGFEEPELLFDVCLHVGTLVAVCAVFYREILSILGTLIKTPALLRSSGGIRPLFAENEDIRLAVLIVAGSVPTAVLGLLFHRMAEQIFGAVWIVGVMLLITGTLLWLTRLKKGTGRSIEGMTLPDALIIGLIQGMAILPGISRSGSTISVALFLGIDRELAGRYSFLLSIPAILGALVLNLDPSAAQTTIPVTTIITGAVFAGVVGYAALVVLLRLVKNGKLYRFSPYCWLLGVGALGWSFMG